MNIPIIDKLMKKFLTSYPKETKFFVEEQLHFKKGQRTASLEVPSERNMSAFELTFPSGLTYKYGDSETEEKSKKVKWKRDPAISITLPDISDKDMTVPVKFGFQEHPKTSNKDVLLTGLIMVGTSLYFGITTLMKISETPISSIISIPIIVIIGILGFAEFRTYQRLRIFWKNQTIKEAQ